MNETVNLDEYFFFKEKTPYDSVLSILSFMWELHTTVTYYRLQNTIF